MLYEPALRVPATDIAQAGQWNYKCEYPIRFSERQHGLTDFVLSYNKQIVGIEYKYYTPQRNTSQAAKDIEYDRKKLLTLFSKDDRVQTYPKKIGIIIATYKERKTTGSIIKKSRKLLMMDSLDKRRIFSQINFSRPNVELATFRVFPKPTIFSYHSEKAIDQ